MSVAKKFDFTNSFDAGDRGMVAARDFTLADMEKARAEAYEKGVAAGKAHERATIEQASATALATVAKRLATLSGELTTLKTTIENEALEAVLGITRKLVPHYAKIHGLDEVEGMTRECLTAVYDEPRVVIRAHEAVLDHIKSRLDDLIASTGFGGKVVLFTDESLAESDCRVEWADGGAERDVARLWHDVEQSISRFLDRDSRTGTASSPSRPTTASNLSGENDG